MKQNHPITIWIAEDDDDDFFLAVKAFGKVGEQINIERVFNGAELLDKLEKQTQAEEKDPYPDLILLDLNMPVMDGRSVLFAIKQKELYSHIPILVMTTSDAEEDILQCYRLGANSYFKKPVNFNDFVDVVTCIKTYWFQTVKLPKIP